MTFPKEKRWVRGGYRGGEGPMPTSPPTAPPCITVIRCCPHCGCDITKPPKRKRK